MTDRTARLNIEERHAVAALKLIMRRRMKMPVWLLLALGLPLAVLALYLRSAGFLGEFGTVLAALVLILGIVLAILHLWVLPRQARRHFHQTRLLGEEITLAWDAEGYSLESERANSRLKWTELHAWAEHDDTLLLMQSEMLFNIVPKSALDPDQQADLRTCLTASGLKRL